MSLQCSQHSTVLRLWFKLLGFVKMFVIRSISERLTSSTLSPPKAAHFPVKIQYPSFQGPTGTNTVCPHQTHLSLSSPPHLPLAYLFQPCWPPHRPSYTAGFIVIGPCIGWTIYLEYSFPSYLCD